MPRPAARLLAGFLALAFACLIQAQPQGRDAGPLQVCLIAADAKPGVLASLARTLGQTLGSSVIVIPAASDGSGRVSLDALQSADTAVFVNGPGPLAEQDATELRRFLHAGKGVVVLAANEAMWKDVPEFFTQFLGAKSAGPFANGAAMNVINLLPHPIYTDVPRFETQDPMPLWNSLADDVQLIMEGTVGEDTAPLAWVRQLASGRLCHIVPAGTGLFGDASYLKILAHAVLWAGRREIPHAQPIVQRTIMPDSHPGSLAITFPNGPGVCFDPVRGGIAFIWDGDFVDLRPRWLTKKGEPARIFGNVFYREQEPHPLRTGAPPRTAAFQFRGYTLKDGVLEFHYRIDGRDVYETMTAIDAGAGLRRSFRVAEGSAPLWISLEEQPEAEIALTGLARDGRFATYSSGSQGRFSIEIRRKPTRPRS